MKIFLIFAAFIVLLSTCAEAKSTKRGRRDVDPCLQEKDEGCLLDGPTETRWFFNKQTNACEEFEWCGYENYFCRNENNFLSKNKCEQFCRGEGE